ncbi:MAG: class I SAM-dependent methyltransferase [Desulfovibrionaceae bacterium]
MDAPTYWNGPGAGKRFTTPVRVERLTAGLAPDARILDYGCGYGRALAELRSAGFTRLTGLDMSAGLVELGKREHPDLDLRTAGPGAIPFPDASFDAALLLAVLTCIRDDAGQAALFAELSRALVPGGRLLVNDFLLGADERSTTRYAKYAPRFGTYGVFELPDGGIMRHHDPADLRRRISAHFEIEDWREETFTTMNGNPARGVTALCRVS